MKKLLALLLVLVMTVSICSTAFAATIIGFEDGTTYGKITANGQYYRKSRIEASNTVAKYGNYSAKISSPKYFEKEIEDYVADFAARFDLHYLPIADESFFDAWFYFPENCNVEQLNIRILDKAGDEMLSIDIMESEEFDTWLSLYDYWGETFGNQDNVGICDMFFLEITGTAVEPEEEVVFYMDNLFFGSEDEFSSYMENPEAAVPVVDNKVDNSTDAGNNNDANKDNSLPSTGGLGTWILTWIIVGGVVAVAVVAAVVVVVVAKKKK